MIILSEASVNKDKITFVYLVCMLTATIVSCSSDNSATSSPNVAEVPILPALTLTTDISASAKDADSDTTMAWLAANGGWGGGTLSVDFSNHLLLMNSSTPTLPIKLDPSYFSPDCDDGLTSFPMPTNGAFEGETGYSCTGGGDCHLLVVDETNGKLYESMNSEVVDDSGVTKLQSTCAIVWDLDKSYNTNIRGDNCTSTDSSGLPLAALLFTADEIAAGEIKHAIRFVLPNARIKAGVFVHPATHAGNPSGPSDAPPVGARFRLKSSFDTSSLKPAAKIVAEAMKKYGMILVDGGSIALSASSDTFSIHKWTDVDFTSADLSSIDVSDFEMVDSGPEIALTYNCVREP